MSVTMLENSIYNDDKFFKLSTEAKFLFIYLITCKDCNLIGCYELPLPVMALYTGIQTDRLLTILKELEPSIVYRNGWVMVLNYEKYNPMRNPNIEKSRDKQLGVLPKKIYKELETLTKGFSNPSITLQGKEQDIKGNEKEQETETISPDQFKQLKEKAHQLVGGKQ